MCWANEARLPLQINTCITRRNLHDLDNVAALLLQFRIVLWSAFFLVPGRGQLADLPAAWEFEEAFANLLRLSKEVPFKVKTTEAQHYRRFLVQHRPPRAGERRDSGIVHTVPGLVPVNEGKGLIFVSHSGEVLPSSFLPISIARSR